MALWAMVEGQSQTLHHRDVHVITFADSTNVSHQLCHKRRDYVAMVMGMLP